MKTRIFIHCLFVLSFAFAVVNCSSGNNNGNRPSNVGVANAAFNQCYNQGTGTFNNPQTCANSNSTCVVQNGACYLRSGQQVNCQSCSGNNGAHQCVGSYYNQDSFTQDVVQCNGSNCAGYTLTNANTGQVETCN